MLLLITTSSGYLPMSVKVYFVYAVDGMSMSTAINGRAVNDLTATGVQWFPS